MYNEYYPENTSSDCFENYGGHHIDDRMKARGSSYARRYAIDKKSHCATPEILEEKKRELAELEALQTSLLAGIYGKQSERMSGNDLVDAMTPLEDISVRISNLRRFISTAKVITPEMNTAGTVQLLSKVTIQMQGMSSTRTCLIVSENNSKGHNDYVSCDTPLGKALLGHKAGESVEVNVNGNKFQCKILSV